MPGRELARSLLLAAVACGGSVNPCAGQIVAPAGRTAQKPHGGKGGSIVVTVSTDKKVYAAGAPIRLTLTARNATREAVQLTFSSGQKFDFEIRRGAKIAGPLLWQWSRDQSFVQMLSGETLKPNQARTYHAVFDPKAAAKAAPPVTLTPGTYTVIGVLTTMQQADRPTGRATFRVQ